MNKTDVTDRCPALKTRVTEALGIEYPILQGAMAWVSFAPLVAAVSNAGGLGIIGGPIMMADQLREEIRKVRALTDKPFGVNLLSLHPMLDAILKMVIEEKVDVATYGTGNPKHMIEALAAGGVKSFPVVPTVKAALRAEADGADGVIVSGCEGGGHVGKMATMSLLPQARDQVKIPLVAAGGMGDGRGMAAAFALGAEGVQLGTRFIVVKESPAHDNVKRKIIEAKPEDTAVTGNITGLPVRVIKNRMAEEFLNMEGTGKGRAEMAMFGSGKMKLAFVEGDAEDGSVMSGQICGMIADEPSCEELIQRMMVEFRRAARGLAELAGTG
jgi:enoyl-[acyl-carrier protein] reductase II